MKKFIVTGFAMILSTLSAQSLLADIKTVEPQTSPAGQNAQPAAVSSSWLGVWVDNIPSELGHHLSSLLKNDQGIIIKQVAPDSPAAKAGLQAYDIIADFNDQAIFSQQQLTQLIQAQAPQTEVQLSIIRQGKLIQKKVMLEVNPQVNSLQRQTPGAHHPGHSQQLNPLHNRPRGQLPAPFANDPFFNSSHYGNGFGNRMDNPFNKDFMDAFNRDFNQQMQQLRQQMQQLEQQMKQQGLNSQQSSWSQFQSIQVESIGKDKHRAAVSYQDSEGNKKEFVFEGRLDEIRQQIMASKEMAEDKKQSLLQALDMNTGQALPWQP